MVATESFQPKFDLPLISPNERLVPDDFEIKVTDEDIGKLFQAGECYPRYPDPSQLLKWDDAKISEWETAGFPDDWIPTMQEAQYSFQPNYQKGLELKSSKPEKFGWVVEDDGQKDFKQSQFESYFEGNYPKTRRGVPIHPDYRLLLKHGVPAAREWSGFYWGKGAQKAGDPVLLTEFTEQIDGRSVRKLKWLGIASKALVENGNQRVNGLPGGMVEKDDPAVTATIKREVMEEAGVSEDYFKDPEVIAEVAVMEGRTGLNAWPESTAALVILPEDEAKKIQLKAGDDASKAHWLDASEEVFDTLFSPTHAKMVKMGVKRWQEKNPGLVVSKSSEIGKRI